MKKVIAVSLSAFLLFLSAPSAFAARTPEEQAKYNEMKEIKAKQRAEREAHRAEVKSGKVEEPGFWAREAKRSGLDQTGNGVGGFVKGLNPVPFFKNQKARYEERKAAGVK